MMMICLKICHDIERMHRSAVRSDDSEIVFGFRLLWIDVLEGTTSTPPRSFALNPAPHAVPTLVVPPRIWK